MEARVEEPGKSPSRSLGNKLAALRPSFIRSLPRLLFGAAILFGLLLYYRHDLETVIPTLHLQWPYAILTLVFVTLTTLVTTQRWRIVAAAMSRETYPFDVCLRAFLLSRMLGYFVSAVVMDVVGRRLGLGAQGKPSSAWALVAQMLVERWLDIVLPLATLAVPLLVAQGLGEFLPLLGLVTVAAAALGSALLVPSFRIIKPLVQRLRRFRGSDIGLALPPRVLFSLAWLSAARWVCVLAQGMSLCDAVGVPIEWHALATGTATSQLAAVAAFTPGGLGIQDAGWIVGLQSAALSGGHSTLITLVQRLGIMASLGLLTAVAWLVVPRRTSATAVTLDKPSQPL